MGEKGDEDMSDEKVRRRPKGFSYTKGDKNYWLDAVRDFWSVTGLDTDCVDLEKIVLFFDEIRDGFNKGV